VEEEDDMHGRPVLVIASLGALALSLVACGGGGSGGQGGGAATIKVAYQLFGGNTQNDQWLKRSKAEFEKANPGAHVQLVPIQASENDYYTKLDVMQRSPSTAPDVVYEDTFLINSDVKAGYLRPLDGYVGKWGDWSQFYPSATRAATGADGKIYGVPTGTDTRALWYNRTLFQKAGIPVPWKPRTWNDVLDAARAVKAKLPGVTPLNVYSGKPMGEASTMQGFEMLLYGTPRGTLYDTQAKKWVAPSKGFTSGLGFIQSVYHDGLALQPQQALDPNANSVVTQQLLPEGKLAIDLDGSWLPETWLPTGPKPWPQWADTIGVTPMPTQDGQAPGAVSMSGGWTLAVGSKSAHPDTAFKFITTALNRDNSQFVDVATSLIAVRKDVAASSEYQNSVPTIKATTDLVQYTHFRPAFPEYPQISNAVQVAMEAVMTGQQQPEAATRAYTDTVTQIVGQDHVMAAGG
jgi:multiple sugar transport system substrate-binding protein